MCPDADPPRAVVLLSGGMDSATVLATALQQGFSCHALGFDYGQRHRIELEMAQRLARDLGAAAYRAVRLDLGREGSALTDPRLPVPEAPTSGIPVTYVPARNTIFLAIAMGWAETLDCRDLFIGVNAVDYSGYPDCRPEFIRAFERLARLATRQGAEGAGMRVHAPLIAMNKAEIVQHGTRLGLDYSKTVSCYRPDPAGRACGRCDACRFRRNGFRDAGLPDPTRYAPGAGE